MRSLIRLTICLILTAFLTLPASATEPEPSQTPPETTVHTHSWTTVTTASTCTAPGSVTNTCACGESTTEALPLAAHAYGAWTAGEADHSRSCSACSTVETAPHSWNPGAVTLQPTCTATGAQTYSCACGASKTETLPTAAHSYGEWGGDENAHSHTCTVCGSTESAGHTWADRTVTVAPTCTEEGVEALFCTVCGGCLYEVLPLADHTFDSVCDPDCNVCGAVRDAGHTYSAAWSKNSREHWHACTRCGDKKDIGSHYPGPAATEEKAQLCLTCGLTLTPRLNHTHKYQSSLTSDETGHWYACSGCEDQKDLQEHAYDDPCDPDCNICGYKTATAHSYGDAYESDESGHRAVCALCGESGDREAHIAEAAATGGEALLCSLCGYEMAPAQEHTHLFEGHWLSDEENHWKACECGEADDPAPHTWDEGRKNKGENTVTYTCIHCAAQIQQAAAESGFPWGMVFWILVLLAAATAGVLVVVLVRQRRQS